ncbi:Ribonuclease H-like superfamily protein [Rhynchospora pubera]|uniref:Ribonuclease H-like superfamily protein n=1 Tax=Rhynchospora pubera TaxID=906938 RepID=A0AAV8CAT6_9POAL|nr:Ribonuclease H-like superfamily protein [Rhynchospora pubera]
MKEAIAVDSVIATRISKTPSGCSLCGHSDESTVHVLFKCPHAQPVWRLSQFNLSTDNLPDRMVPLMTFLLNNVDHSQYSMLINIMWVIWKDICKRVFEGKRTNPQVTLASALNWMITMEKAQFTLGTSFYKRPNDSDDMHVAADFHFWIDASWSHADSQGTGMAYILFDREGILVQYQLTDGQAYSPFHAELLSLKMALLNAMDKGILNCAFYTDCLDLQRVIAGKDSPESVEWRSYYDVLEVIALWKKHSAFICTHVNRGKNELADSLAKYARIRGVCTLDFTFPPFHLSVM